MPDSADFAAEMEATIQAEQPPEDETPAIESFPLIPSPTDDEARQFAVDSLNADFQESLVYDLATETRARELDRLYAELPMVPKSWLQRERQMGQLRNPFQPEFRNGTVGMALEAAALNDPRYRGVLAFLQKDAGYRPPAPNYEREAKIARQEAAKQRVLDEINHYAANPQLMQPWGAGASVAGRRPPVSPEPGSRTLYRG